MAQKTAVFSLWEIHISKANDVYKKAKDGFEKCVLNWYICFHSLVYAQSVCFVVECNTAEPA
jgi:hypothetical protein